MRRIFWHLLEGASPDAPIFFSAVQRTALRFAVFSFRHLSEGSSPDEPICYSCQFGCSGEQPSKRDFLCGGSGEQSYEWSSLIFKTVTLTGAVLRTEHRPFNPSLSAN